MAYSNDYPRLTKIQFAEEYLRNGENATQAYLTVIDPEADYKIAMGAGPRLARDPEVRDIIQTARAKALDRLEVTQEWIARQLLSIAGFDLADLIGDNDEALPISEIPKDARMALAGLEIEELFDGRGEDRVQIGRLKKFKTCDRIKALELLGRWRRMFVDKVEHSGEMTLAQIIERLDKREEDGPDPDVAEMLS